MVCILDMLEKKNTRQNVNHIRKLADLSTQYIPIVQYSIESTSMYYVKTVTKAYARAKRISALLSNLFYSNFDMLVYFIDTI